MPRSSAPFLLSVVSVLMFAWGGACTFAPPSGTGSSGTAASGGPLGSGASSGSGTGLIGGGGAQTGTGNITGMNCAMVNQNVDKLPPDILVVLDKSGSMNDDPATGMACMAAGCMTK